MARKSISHERVDAMTGVSPSWLMRFVKEHPRVRGLAPGVEQARLEGAIDVHVHADPCSLIVRSQDFTDVALECAGAGMRAVIRKDHLYSTVGEAHAIQRHIDYLVDTGALARRIEVYGGIPTRFAAEPALIKDALRFPELKKIWANPVGGVPLVEEGRVKPAVLDLITMARDHGIGINLGAPNHSAAYAGVSDYDGLAPLVEAVARIGAKACLDHPLSAFDVDEIEKLTPDGVYAGLFCFPSLPSIIKAPLSDPAETLELVRRIGAERCLVASDVGTLLEPSTMESLRLMIRFLLGLGISGHDVDLMLKVNPAKLIGLEPPALAESEAPARAAE
jgi:Family of unknown function (DUF6282)